MKKIYEAIKKNDYELVKNIVTDNPEIVNSVYNGKTVKDDGQSPLQISLKKGRLKIANYLIEHEADINFIETDSVNEWKAPVIHDAIRCAMMSSRWNTYDKYNDKIEVLSSKERADFAFKILEKIIKKGANVNARDSYGNTCLDVFVIISNQILPHYDVEKDKMSDDRILTDEIKEDLSRIAKLLIDNGADVNNTHKHTKKSFRDAVKTSILSKIITFDI